ncbi:MULTISPECIES: signal peptidase I [Thermomonosporaceae]|uniref:signal peptidase I n=1 Tax=Thermomonosporaceae TaxID=2012 RepID=UPI00255AF1D8|nr:MULTISPECIES: signal peptidase I [Thermomonosporaceae]MDL4774993.1 signal peptidase I [Actinomadura xylanilytica]
MTGDERDADSGGQSDGPSPDGTSSGNGEKRRSFWKEMPVLIAVAVVLALVIKAFAVQAFYIPSGSMRGTLEINDRVLVSKIDYRVHDIRRGDIIVFNGVDSWTPEVPGQKPRNLFSKALHQVGGAFGVTSGETDFIKRVIARGGDRVSCAGSGAPVMVNGIALDERSYLLVDPVTHERSVPSVRKFSVVVPKGRLWVMGDNRGNSFDSRGHTNDPGGGSIPEDKVIGRAFAVVWPLGHWKYLSGPETFHQPGM